MHLGLGWSPAGRISSLERRQPSGFPPNLPWAVDRPEVSRARPLLTIASSSGPLLLGVSQHFGTEETMSHHCGFGRFEVRRNVTALSLAVLFSSCLPAALASTFDGSPDRKVCLDSDLRLTCHRIDRGGIGSLIRLFNASEAKSTGDIDDDNSATGRLKIGILFTLSNRRFLVRGNGSRVDPLEIRLRLAPYTFLSIIYREPEKDAARGPRGQGLAERISGRIIRRLDSNRRLEVEAELSGRRRSISASEYRLSGPLSPD